MKASITASGSAFHRKQSPPRHRLRGPRLPEAASSDIRLGAAGPARNLKPPGPWEVGLRGGLSRIMPPDRPGLPARSGGERLPSPSTGPPDGPLPRARPGRLTRERPQGGPSLARDGASQWPPAAGAGGAWGPVGPGVAKYRRSGAPPRGVGRSGRVAAGVAAVRRGGAWTCP